MVRGAHAPRILAMASRHRELLRPWALRRGRRNGHARRVCYPDPSGGEWGQSAV